uniref:RNA-binding protein 7 n=1 Tax=Lygus hesperus TaxID=30085 RepID=A0A146L9E0_LYGHE
MSQDQNTVYVGNLSDKVTEELLYELFLQAGPVENVNIPKQKPFGFVRFKHQCSVPYVINLLEGISLFGKTLKVAPRGMALPYNMGQPGMGPPMGLSHNMASMVQRPLIHPLSQHGRISSLEPRNHRKGGRNNDEGDLRDKLKTRSRPKDPMMPSSRKKKVETPSQKEMDAIPDFLGSGFDPLYSSGPFVAPYQFDGRDERDWGRDNRNQRKREPSQHGDQYHGGQRGNQHRRGRNEGHHRSHHDNPRRDRSPHHSSSRRKHF